MRRLPSRSSGSHALIVVLWRPGLRISEAPALAESDRDRASDAVLVRCGKGRGVAWTVGAGGRAIRGSTCAPNCRVGALLCVMHGPTAGPPWSPCAARMTLRKLAVAAGVRRRLPPQGEARPGAAGGALKAPSELLPAAGLRPEVVPRVEVTKVLPAIRHTTVLELQDQAAVNLQVLAASLSAVAMKGQHAAITVSSHVPQLRPEGPSGLAPQLTEVRKRRVTPFMVAGQRAGRGDRPAMRIEIRLAERQRSGPSDSGQCRRQRRRRCCVAARVQRAVRRITGIWRSVFVS